jgi:hypothetical protein
MSGSKLELNEEQQVALDQVGFTKNLFFFRNQCCIINLSIDFVFDEFRVLTRLLN